MLMPNFFDSMDINAGAIAHGFFYVVVGLALLYTLIVTYHWIRYGYRSLMAIPALAVHALVSLALIGLASSGL